MNMKSHDSSCGLVSKYQNSMQQLRSWAITSSIPHSALKALLNLSSNNKHDLVFSVISIYCGRSLSTQRQTNLRSFHPEILIFILS